MSASDRIAMTGVGAVTPLGSDAPSTWQRLVAGDSGIRSAALTTASGINLDPVPAGALPFDPGALVSPVEARRLDRAQQIALTAAREAWNDAGAPDIEGGRLATSIGTGIGGVLTLLAQHDALEAAGQRRVSPRTVPMLMPNAASAVISIEFGARAGAYTPVSACASGAEAIAMGARLIRDGDADVVIAGGTEAAIAAITVAGFAQARALTHYHGDPADASRPFAADRSGFVLGEGAGAVVLEREDHARARGAHVHAILAGFGITSDAHHITAPDPNGAGQISAMLRAVQRAGLAPNDISHVNAHATGTPLGDAAESAAVQSLFGRTAITAPKAALGHLFGAAGAVEAIIAALAVEHDLIPPTRNLGEAGVDPTIDADVVTTARSARQDAAISNSFGFGGQNVSLLFTKQ